MNLGPYEIFVVMLLCGFGCAGIARRKGLRVGAAFILGVLAPPIGFIVVALTRPRRFLPQRN